MFSGGIELAPLITKMKVDIAGFKSDMEKVKVEAVTQAKQVSKELERTANVGKNLSKIGGILTKGVTVPILGVGTAITKMSMDFDSSFAKVSTLLDENIVDFNKYQEELLNASSDSKVAIEDFSEAVYQSISAGVDQTKAINFTTDAMKLAKGGFTDGAKAVDILTTAINGYSLSSEDAARISDLLITTQNLGKTTVDELASSMGAVIPVASSVNFSVEELSASYAQLTKNGIATAESGTYLRSMLSELGKSGSIADKTLRELTGKGFADLKAEGKATSEIISMLNDEAIKNDKSLKDMFGSVEAGTAAMVLFKGEGQEYNEMLEAMGDSAGATQEAFDKMDSTKAEQLKGALNELKNAGIELGANLLPIITDFAEGLSKLVEGYNNLSPEQQEMILKLGLIAAATGPVLKVTGSLITGYTKLKPLLSGVTTLFSKGTPLLGRFGKSLGEAAGSALGASKNMGGLTTIVGNLGLKLMEGPGLLGKLGTALAGAATSSGGLLASLGGVVSAAAPFALAAGGVALAVKGVADVLSTEVVPEVDLFADHYIQTTQTISAGGQMVTQQVTTDVVKISEATKIAVEAYMDMDNAITQDMYSMQINHTVITDQIANSTIASFQNMANTIITSQNESYNQQLSDYRNFFDASSALTEEREAEILANITSKHNERQETIELCMEKISAIYQKAADENRELTKQEQQDIKQLQDEMRDNAISTLSATEEEAAVIRERMKDYQGRLSAEMASEMITRANEARDGEIEAAESKYDELLRQALRMREAGDITEEEYELMKKEAEDNKKEQIKSAKQACQGIKTEIKRATPGIEDEVDIQSGKIKNTWDKMCDYANDGWNYINGLFNSSSTKANSIKGLADGWGGYNGSHYNGLSYVPFDGYNARLHKGERILTEKENKAYTAGLGTKNGTSNITISGNTFNVRDDSDIEKIAQKLYELQLKEQRGLGFV